MQRRLFALLAVSVLLSVAVFAASVHFKHEPTFTDQGVVLLAQGSLAGLSNADVSMLITATALPAATCTNRGGSTAPGQNPAEVTVSGSVFVSHDSIQNGQLYYTLQTQVPTLTWEQAGCPNGNWQATLVDLAFEEATITVVQDGQVVLQQTFEL